MFAHQFAFEFGVGDSGRNFAGAAFLAGYFDPMVCWWSDSLGSEYLFGNVDYGMGRGQRLRQGSPKGKQESVFSK